MTVRNEMNNFFDDLQLCWKNWTHIRCVDEDRPTEYNNMWVPFSHSQSIISRFRKSPKRDNEEKKQVGRWLKMSFDFYIYRIKTFAAFLSGMMGILILSVFFINSSMSAIPFQWTFLMPNNSHSKQAFPLQLACNFITLHVHSSFSSIAFLAIY